MKLNEAKQILNKNGYLLEGSMSLKDKIANAKKFNNSSFKDDITEMIDNLNNDYHGTWQFRLDEYKKSELAIIAKTDDFADEEMVDEIEWVWYFKEDFVDVFYCKQGDSDILDDNTVYKIKTIQELENAIRNDNYLQEN